MDVDIRDNKLVLVGENGTGKSTFANLIYYFLTRQWRRLHSYRFRSITAVLGGEVLTVTAEHLKEHFSVRKGLRYIKHFPPHLGPAIVRMVESAQQELFDYDEILVAKFSEELHVPPRVAREMLIDAAKEAKKGPQTHVGHVERRLSELVKGQCLYLPTYRRIEQDLRSIFRDLELDAELRKFRDRLTRRRAQPYVELVEFGMEDVEQAITRRMSQIKERVRNGLDSLTGSYLRDVLRGVHTKVDVQQLSAVNRETLEAVFVRIDEATLPTLDKEHLKAKVENISATRAVAEEDKVIAHFLLRLIELYTDQQANEKDVREFVRICNGYLSGKELVYDNTTYTISIGAPEAPPESDTLELRMLSSGEKQIVSLFSHLYLSGEKQFFVIIDEPELSLSVPWQRRFLPDILETGMCTGLVAVTHSPFVWDNALEPYVRAITEFREP